MIESQLYLLSAVTVDPKKALTELKSLVTQVEGTIEKEEDLGLRRLHYPINKHKELSLVSVFFRLDEANVAELNEELKHASILERFLLTRWNASLEARPRRSRPREILNLTEKTEVNV